MRRMINRDELKQIQLQLLAEFDKYCTDNNLHYYLFAGSLIGAVRHGGFIPWDDDIDIIMPRKDYNALVCKFNKENNDSTTKLIDIEIDDNYYLPYGKIYNVNTVLIENCTNRIELGVNIDVFALDNVGNDKKKAWNQYKKIKKYKDAITFKQVEYSRKRGCIKNIILVLGKSMLKPIALKKLLYKVRELCRYREGFDQDKYVCNLAGAIYGIGEIHLKDWYKESKRVKFENIEVNIPIGYDKILKGLYGDYMSLPPVEKRTPHHQFEAWWKDAC